MPDSKGELKGYNAPSQTGKNIAWFLPRPKPDRYKGGMPLYAEEWLVSLAQDILNNGEAKVRNVAQSMLHVFCGAGRFGYRVDIKDEVNPDLCCDIHKLSAHLNPKEHQFLLVLADPPYSTQEAKDLYGTPPLRYKAWTKECDKFLMPGGLFMVYHKNVMPNPDPEKYVVVKRVFIGNRTMHLPRVCVVFQKKGL